MSGEAKPRNRRKRRPILSPIAWELSCPSCYEGLAVPGNGSLMWTEQDFLGSTIYCGCGEAVALPNQSRGTGTGAVAEGIKNQTAHEPTKGGHHVE